MKGVFYTVLMFFKFILTVCKSLLNRIKVIKPAMITNGIKLIRANNFPRTSPRKKEYLEKFKQKHHANIVLKSYIIIQE